MSSINSDKIVNTETMTINSNDEDGLTSINQTTNVYPKSMNRFERKRKKHIVEKIYGGN